MDPIHLATLFAIFQEMLGGFLWPLLVFGLLAPLLFLMAVWRDHGLRARLVVLSQALGLVGGALALILMAWLSSSGFTDAGGPIDWLLIALIFVLGMLWTAFAVYGTVVLWAGCRRRPQPAVSS